MEEAESRARVRFLGLGPRFEGLELANGRFLLESRTAAGVYYRRRLR